MFLVNNIFNTLFSQQKKGHATKIMAFQKLERDSKMFIIIVSLMVKVDPLMK